MPKLPSGLSSPAFIRIIADCLREDLIDPGAQWGTRSVAPVVAMETLHGLRFVQQVACLN